MNRTRRHTLAAFTAAVLLGPLAELCAANATEAPKPSAANWSIAGVLQFVEPERAKELAAKWEAWAVRAHVKPYPAPRAVKATKPKQKRRTTSSTGEP